MAKPFCLLYHQALHLFAPQLLVLQLLVMPNVAAPMLWLNNLDQSQ